MSEPVLGDEPLSRLLMVGLVLTPSYRLDEKEAAQACRAELWRRRPAAPAPEGDDPDHATH
jgi:hypothetical protein